MKAWWASFALLVYLGASAAAQEQKCCCTTLDTSICLAKVLKKVDLQLNDTYQKSLKTVEDSAQDGQNLRDAQRAWIAYRDAACKAEYDLWGGGTGGPNAHTICIIRITRQRTTDLHKTYLER